MRLIVVRVIRERIAGIADFVGSRIVEAPSISLIRIHGQRAVVASVSDTIELHIGLNCVRAPSIRYIEDLYALAAAEE